jgi:isoleucyl-tRNA synthetase
VAADKDRAWILRRYERMLSDELNVKRVEVVESRDMMVHYAVAPNLKILGPKLKESAGEVSKLLSKMDQNALAIHLSAKGKIRIGGFDLRAEDVLIYEKEKPGYSHAEVGDIHVYAELEMSQNLLLEGLSREIIRRVQHMRKELRLEFEDPVIVEFSGHPDVEIAFSAHRSHIMHEVHAIRLERNPGLAGGRKWIINKLPVELVVRKA